MLRKLIAMFGIEQKATYKPDKISAETTVAIQRNERASRKVQETLEDMKMADTMRYLTGKMK